MALENLFGELANDFSIKSLIPRLSKLSFDPSGQLRVGGSVGVSGTLTAITTANMSIGDMGKASAAQLQSAQGFYGSVGANFIRS